MGTKMHIVDKEETLQSNKQQNDKLGAYIMASLDMENNFRMFSYRIIDQTQFMERAQDIARVLNTLI